VKHLRGQIALDQRRATDAHRSVETVEELTTQEFHIARLAREGLSNAEIGLGSSSALALWNGISERCSRS
jgi:DNA-binding NarL/FixJ family response regulator